MVVIFATCLFPIVFLHIWHYINEDSFPYEIIIILGTISNCAENVIFCVKPIILYFNPSFRKVQNIECIVFLNRLNLKLCFFRNLTNIYSTVFWKEMVTRSKTLLTIIMASRLIIICSIPILLLN